jgi:putative transposase
MRKRRGPEEARKVLSDIDREVAKGLTVGLACRTVGVSVNTYYRWKTRFDEQASGDAARVRTLESENRRLKALVAELALDKQMLQEVVQKKW